MALQDSGTSSPDLAMNIVDAWRTVVDYVADGHADEFSGDSKETFVFRRLGNEIKRGTPEVCVVGPDSQERFRRWSIDLVCASRRERIAVEGKFKIRSDGAIPYNRKAAFFDLYKLEAYVTSGKYSKGLFLWLTNESQYLVPASGDSRDFSTHRGRIYDAGTLLHARRSRSTMPLPLILTRSYVFEWLSAGTARQWHHLILAVNSKGM